MLCQRISRPILRLNAFGLTVVASFKVNSLSTVLSQAVIPSAYCESSISHISPPPTFKSNLASPNPDIQSNLKSTPLSTLWKFVKADWILLISVSLTAITTALVNVWTPRLIGSLANILSSNHLATTTFLTLLVQIRRPALLLSGLFAMNGLLTFVYISMVTILGERIAKRLRLKLYDTLLAQPISFFDIMRTGDLISLLSSDISDFKHSFKICISHGLKSFTQILGHVVQLFAISHVMTGYLFLAAPVLYGLGNLYGNYLRYLSKLSKEAEGLYSALASEVRYFRFPINLISLVSVYPSSYVYFRAFASEEFELKRFRDAIEKSSDAANLLGYNIGVFQGFTNFAIGGMVVYVLYIGGYMVGTQQISGGDLMSYLLSIQSAQKSLASLSVLFAQSVKAMSAFNRVDGFLSLKCNDSRKTDMEKIPSSLSGRIKFNNVSFAYPSRPDHQVFDGFNMEIPAGKVYALCGSSGSGKSTIGALIEKFYEPSDGYITLDGVDIKDIDSKWLRQNIGYIHQEPILFAGSILDNIRYAQPDATIDQVKEAARLANAGDFIENLPDKYETVVGERGVTLSGGQRQRIAIARALLKNPRILIFDEATSALDANSERIVQEALNRLMVGRTVILIAHRLSTIQDAHQIILLGKEGKIVESGTHEELIRLRGGYYSLYRSLHDS